MEYLDYLKSKFYFISFVALILLTVLALANSITFHIEAYAKLIWSVDYSMGFCKRGFLGFLYSIFTDVFDIPRTESALIKTMFAVHGILSVVFLFLIISLYKILANAYRPIIYLVFSVFAFLLTSHFVRTTLGYIGYLDIILLDVYLIILLLLSKGRIYSASFIASLFCLVTELSCVFWIPVAVVWLAVKKIQKDSFVLVLPVVAGLLTHKAGTPYEHFADFASANGLTISDTSIKNIKATFEDQYNIIDCATRRISFIFRHIPELFLSFIILALILPINIFINYKVSKLLNVTFVKRSVFSFLLVLLTFMPLSLMLVAIDFWRFVGFCIFITFLLFASILLVLNIEGDADKKDFSVCRLHWSLYLAGFVISFLTAFSPQLRTFGTSFIAVSPHVQENMNGESSFVFPTFVWNNEPFYTMLSYFPFAFYDNFKKQQLSNVICPYSGKRILGTMQMYGRLRIVIDAAFQNNDPDPYKMVKIYGHLFKIEKQKETVIYFDLSKPMSKMYPVFNVFVQPSSADWLIQSLQISIVEPAAE